MNIRQIFGGRWRGLKIGLLGIGLGYLGVSLSIYTEQCGWVLFFIAGFIVTLAGMVFHLKDWRKELMTPAEELYKKEKQPWDQDED